MGGVPVHSRTVRLGQVHADEHSRLSGYSDLRLLSSERAAGQRYEAVCAVRYPQPGDRVYLSGLQSDSGADGARKCRAAAHLPRYAAGGTTPSGAGGVSLGRSGKAHGSPSGRDVRRTAAACCDRACGSSQTADHHGGRADRQSGFCLRSGYYAQADCTQ